MEPAGSARLERGTVPPGTVAPIALAANNPPPAFFVMGTEALGTVAGVENGTCLLPAVQGFLRIECGRADLSASETRALAAASAMLVDGRAANS